MCVCFGSLSPPLISRTLSATQRWRASTGATASMEREKKKGWGVKGGVVQGGGMSLSPLSSLLYLPVSGVYVGVSRACAFDV